MTGYTEVDWSRVLDALNNVRRKRWEQRRAEEAEREERKEAPASAEQQESGWTTE